MYSNQHGSHPLNLRVFVVMSASVLGLLIRRIGYCWLCWSLVDESLSGSFLFRETVTPRIMVSAQSSSDLYQILGVPRQASKQEIKRAYRKKALDTHPDKNPDIPAEEAAQAFQQVVQAFEVLSDPNSRRQYDRSGRVPNTNNNNSGHQHRHHHQQQQQWTSQGGGFHFHFFNNGGRQFYERPKPKLKEKPEVKRAQSRLMHIVSWEQFQTVLMENDVLERHVLIAAVNPRLEEHVMDEMVFPFPFAGMSPQSIWWEDILQTVMIRYHNQNELTQKLKLPKGQSLTQPIFLLGKKGQSIDDQWASITTNSRDKLQNWVWSGVQVELQFVNYHNYPVEIYWIDRTKAHLKFSHVDPGEIKGHYTRLTHEWYVRDKRVDARKDSPGRYKMTENSALLQFKVLNATSPQIMAIPLRTCFDLSGHCAFWNNDNQCTENPRFMAEVCSLTCGLCSDEMDKIHIQQALNGTYVPPSRVSNQELRARQKQQQPAQQAGHDEL